MTFVSPCPSPGLSLVFILLTVSILPVGLISHICSVSIWVVRIVLVDRVSLLRLSHLDLCRLYRTIDRVSVPRHVTTMSTVSLRVISLLL